MPASIRPQRVAIWPPHGLRLGDPEFEGAEVEIPNEAWRNLEVGQTIEVKVVAMEFVRRVTIDDDKPEQVAVMPKVKAPAITDDLGAAGGH